MHYAPYLPLSYMYSVLHSIFQNHTYEIAVVGLMNPDSCTIMSLNCQSLNSKFSHIKLLLDKFAESDKPIHVLCLQETWIEDSELIDMA